MNTVLPRKENLQVDMKARRVGAIGKEQWKAFLCVRMAVYSDMWQLGWFYIHQI